MTILAISFLFSSCVKKENPVEISEREAWEIRGKWRLQLEKHREYEKQPQENFEITVVDKETFEWQKSLIKK